ncbi:mucin-13-like isoform X2 [Pomacea canaliculata]|uniref:mucin-13-like isoform X2 n=1 Tax=Pomacea canaliculata TaxID=400727 RepID=UPI000D73B07D|nr:mucin-13-like isoform X2 [Pomacea canaliculata]
MIHNMHFYLAVFGCVLLTGTAGQVTLRDDLERTKSPFDVPEDVLFESATREDVEVVTSFALRQDALQANDVMPDARSGANSVSPVLQAAPVPCDVISNSGCQVSGFERCLEPGYCGCLNGYLRQPDTGNCVAAQFFQGEISFVDRFSEKLLDKNGQDFKNLANAVRQVVMKALISQGTRGVLDVYVTSISRNLNTKRVTVKWELAVTSAFNPKREDLMAAYNKGIVDAAYVDTTDSLIKITDTSLVLGNNGTMATFLQPIMEFSHCVDKNHNYCAANADCFHSLASFQCACRAGFDDVSPAVSITPGETCIESCGCENNGTCQRDGTGSTKCRCPDWYLGSTCGVNGKDVLIICCSVIGCLIILTVILCVFCFCTSCSKDRKSSRSSTVGVGSLDTSVVKLPRVWMEGPRPYEMPPRDMRRWSYVSEPVRYVDEYMMDDYVHAETLPLPRSQDAKKKYYAAYQVGGTLNHGYSSSTLSARPMPRH